MVGDHNGRYGPYELYGKCGKCCSLQAFKLCTGKFNDFGFCGLFVIMKQGFCCSHRIENHIIKSSTTNSMHLAYIGQWSLHCSMWQQFLAATGKKKTSLAVLDRIFFPIAHETNFHIDQCHCDMLRSKLLLQQNFIFNSTTAKPISVRCEQIHPLSN